MVQTTQRLEERLGRPGSPVQAQPFDSITRIAEAAIRPSDLAIRGDDAASSGKGAQPLIAPLAADPDAIMLSQALAAGAEVWSGAGLDGAIGAALIGVPGRNINLVLNSHVDWDVSTITVTGEDEYGRIITEDYAVPDAGNVTLTGTKTFRKVTQVDTPAGSGTNRTIEVGTGTLLGPLTARDVLGMVRYLAAREVADNATEEFAQYDVLNVITGGRVWVEAEEAVLDGEQVYVRLVIAGAEEINGFRNDRDGTAAAPDAVPWIGARFHGDSETRDGVIYAQVQFDMTAGQ